MIARPRLGTALLSAFGLASLLLAAVGIFGLMSYSVTQRSSQIAVRSALGTRTVLASQLYGISALDPIVFSMVLVTMLAVALLSAYLPARPVRSTSKSGACSSARLALTRRHAQPSTDSAVTGR